MTPAQEAKAAGFKSLKELAEYLNVSPRNLQRWHKTRHKFFMVLVKGAAVERLNKLES